MLTAPARCFLAVELPETVRAAVGAFTGPFRARTEAVRWTEPSNLHVTLQFLGTVDPLRLGAVRAAARRVAQEIRPFHLALAGAGTFPDLRRPQVLWIGFGEGREELSHAASLVQDALQAERFETERRPFTAHLTVARVKETGEASRLTTIDFLKAALPSIQPFEINRVTLFQSHLSQRGSRYEILEQYPFFC